LLYKEKEPDFISENFIALILEEELWHLQEQVTVALSVSL
jgi:hypothetical protein